MGLRGLGSSPTIPAVTLSRRTWLWTSTAALATACGQVRSKPATRLPDGGVAEGPRALTRRGADNLLALAELAAAIRWLHPSDQASATEWEPLLLAGVRSLEPSSGRVELVEGLRGLFGDVAPTVVVWRAGKEADGDALDERACPDPDAADPDAAELEGDAAKPEPAKTKAKPNGPGPDSEADVADQATGAGESRARDPEPTHGSGRPPVPEPRPPARTTKGKPSESEQPSEADATLEADATPSESDAKPDESGPPSESEETPSESERPSGDAKPSEAEKPSEEPSEAEEPSEPEKPNEPDHDADEPAPELPQALFADPVADAELTITQWQRRGYADGSIGCAARVSRAPDASEDPAQEPSRHRRRGTDGLGCAGSAGAEPVAVIAPGAPMRIELPRGLASLVPLALWTRAGATLPNEGATAGREPGDEVGAELGPREAASYDLDDRGTRLLAVLRAWSLLRRFSPHASGDARALVIPALCVAAEDPSPVALREAIEAMLAGFGDGNAELIVASGRAARRWRPALSLAWVEDRVVVARSAAAQAQPGDVVAAIDGVSIDALVAERLRQSVAATASAAIERAVAGLLARDRKGATIELALIRAQGEADERELVLSAPADQRADRPHEPADARPEDPLRVYPGGQVYVDATRIAGPGLHARRLRGASRVILDLRGALADPKASWLAWFGDAAGSIAVERAPSGPTPAGELPLEPIGARTVEPARRPSGAEVVVLADARTRGHAELELLGFSQVPGLTIVGSASAGDLGGVATAWLPGGWQLRFTTTELRRPDGSAVYGIGVRPTVPVESTRTSLRAGEDPLLAAALALASGRGA